MPVGVIASFSPENYLTSTQAGVTLGTEVGDPQPSFYNNFSIDNSYTYDAGSIVLPVAGPDGTAPRVIKTHASIGYRKAKWDANKSKTPPWFPEIAVNTPSGDVFLSGTLDIPLPLLRSDQSQYIYKVAGEYTYVQPGAPRDSSNVWNTGAYPFKPALMEMWQIFSPAFDTVGEPIEPNWSDRNYVWTSEEIAGFFMSPSLIT